jgi:hypothetical protein
MTRKVQTTAPTPETVWGFAVQRNSIGPSCSINDFQLCKRQVIHRPCLQ